MAVSALAIIRTRVENFKKKKCCRYFKQMTLKQFCQNYECGEGQNSDFSSNDMKSFFMCHVVWLDSCTFPFTQNFNTHKSSQCYTLVLLSSLVSTHLTKIWETRNRKASCCKGSLRNVKPHIAYFYQTVLLDCIFVFFSTKKITSFLVYFTANA